MVILVKHNNHWITLTKISDFLGNNKMKKRVFFNNNQGKNKTFLRFLRLCKLHLNGLLENSIF